MSNFIAFRFTDNDFHGPLREAIHYVVENTPEIPALDIFGEFVLRGMVAFNSIRWIDQRALNERYDYLRYRAYFGETLKVSEIESLDELENFEGYILNKNTRQIFYRAD